MTAVSADAYEDERLGPALLQGRHRASTTAMPRSSAHVTLLPGMPVESFIQTGDRSALSYFVKPMEDYFTRAFRDG